MGTVVVENKTLFPMLNSPMAISFRNTFSELQHDCKVCPYTPGHEAEAPGGGRGSGSSVTHGGRPLSPAGGGHTTRKASSKWWAEIKGD